MFSGHQHSCQSNLLTISHFLELQPPWFPSKSTDMPYSFSPPKSTSPFSHVLLSETPFFPCSLSTWLQLILPELGNPFFQKMLLHSLSYPSLESCASLYLSSYNTASGIPFLFLCFLRLG